MKTSRTYILGLIFAAVIALLELVFKGAQTGSLLLTLLVLTSLVQGAIAVVAMSEASEGKWLAPLKRHLLSLYPLILIMTALFVLMFPRLHLYPWMDHPGVWLNGNFFMVRNIAMLLLTFIFARAYAKRSLSEAPNKRLFSILYLLVYVVAQSLIAFDWVMSLEDPWISTLFGGYFFIEAIFNALSLAAIIAYFMNKRNDHSTDVAFKKSARDVSAMIFGFSIIRAYFFFSQWIVLWYGNIPEEVSYITHRWDHPTFRFLLIVSNVCMFIVPFFALLFDRIKDSRKATALVGLIILAGFFIERITMLAPDLALSVPLSVLETGLAIVLIVWVLKSKSLRAQ